MKNQIKKSLSLLMAVLMLMSCWVWVAPEKVEATEKTVSAETPYVVTITFYVDDACNNATADFFIKHRNKNGTGNEVEEKFDMSDARFGNEGQTYTQTMSVEGFPTELRFYTKSGAMNTHNIQMKKITLNGVTILDGTFTNEGGWGASRTKTWRVDGSGDFGNDTAHYNWTMPEASSLGPANSDSINIIVSDTLEKFEKNSIDLLVYDQYGVMFSDVPNNLKSLDFIVTSELTDSDYKEVENDKIYVNYDILDSVVKVTANACKKALTSINSEIYYLILSSNEDEIKLNSTYIKILIFDSKYKNSYDINYEKLVDDLLDSHLMNSNFENFYKKIFDKNYDENEVSLGVWDYDYTFKNPDGTTTTVKAADACKNIREFLINTILGILWGGSIQTTLFKVLNETVGPAVYNIAGSIDLSTLGSRDSWQWFPELLHMGLPTMPHDYVENWTNTLTGEHNKEFGTISDWSVQWYKYFNGEAYGMGGNPEANYEQILYVLDKAPIDTKVGEEREARSYWKGFTYGNIGNIDATAYRQGDVITEGASGGQALDSRYWAEGKDEQLPFCNDGANCSNPNHYFNSKTCWHVNDWSDFYRTMAVATCGFHVPLAEILTHKHSTGNSSNIYGEADILNLDATIPIENIGDEFYNSFFMPLYNILGIEKYSSSNPYGYRDEEDILAACGTYSTENNMGVTVSSITDSGFTIWNYLLEPIVYWLENKFFVNPFQSVLNMLPNVSSFFLDDEAISSLQNSAVDINAILKPIGITIIIDVTVLNLSDIVMSIFEDFGLNTATMKTGVSGWLAALFGATRTQIKPLNDSESVNYLSVDINGEKKLYRDEFGYYYKYLSPFSKKLFKNIGQSYFNWLAWEDNIGYLPVDLPLQEMLKLSEFPNMKYDSYYTHVIDIILTWLFNEKNADIIKTVIDEQILNLSESKLLTDREKIELDFLKLISSLSDYANFVEYIDKLFIEADEEKHTWDDGEVVYEANCVLGGIRCYTCLDCGRTKRVAIEKLPHTNVVNRNIDATCTENGKIEYVCSVCGELSFESNGEKATGHTYIASLIKPTCQEVGYTKHICEKCNDEYRDSYLAVIDHEYESEHFNATDEKDAYTHYCCIYCGKNYDIIDPATPVENFNALPGAYSITLSWSKSVEATVTGYNIYRKTADTDYALLKTITSRNTLSYVDTGLTAGVEYTYKIMAVKDSIAGIFSDEVSAVAQKDLEAPMILSFAPVNLSKLNKTITLEGNATDNLGYVKYRISYTTDESKEKINLVETEYQTSNSGFSISYDTNNLEDGTYVFYLTAIDKEGNESAAIKRTYLIDNTGPIKVTGLSAVSVYASSATIRWNADENQETFYYKLQQKNGDVYTDVASQISTLGYNLNDLKPSTTYIYRVVGVDELGNIGEWSDDYELTTTKDITPPVIVSQSPKSADFSTEITYSVTATDDTALKKIVIQVSRDKKNWENIYSKDVTSVSKRSSASYTLSLSEYEEGLIYIRGIAYDTSGLCSIDQAAPHSEYNIDKTAPEKINHINALGGNGYIEVKWENIADAAGYNVYRSTSANGTYEKIATVKSLNYIDTSVSEGTAYYYKVISFDAAGNVSESSGMVYAIMNPDTEAPYIKQINLSSNRNSLTIVACDNRQVNSITAEYKIGENGTYTALTGSYSGSGSTKTLTVSLPYSSFAHDSLIYIRAKAEDGVGLSSEYSKEFSFKVDKAAPTIDNLTATVNEDNISVAFTGSEDDDVSLYYISYSKNDSSWNRYASVSPNETKSYCYTKSFKKQGNGSYRFRVEAVDTTGNTNYYFTQPITFTVANSSITDTNVLSANFLAPSYMEVSVSEYFDGSLCTSVNGISEYFWDFGDGTTSNIQRPSKAFSSEGTYTVSLTVFDKYGNSSTRKNTIVVSKREKLGTVKVTVKDDLGNLMSNMPVYFDLGADNQSAFLTDSNGTVTRKISEGNHVVGACKAPDYLPVKKNVAVVGGSTTEVTLVTVNQTIYDAEISVDKMTLSEIIASGVDVEDPANNNYYYATIEFRYGEYIYKGNYIRNDNTIIDIKWPSIKPIYPSDDDIKPNVTPPTVVYIPNNEGLELLAMISVPTTIGYLKDFYNVSFTLINNASSDFTIINNEITLQIPAGLSLLSGVNGFEDKATVTIDELYGGTSRTVNWCLSGDLAGSYNISVTANGVLDEFNIPLSVTAVNAEPISVLSMADTIKLRIETPDSLFVRLKEDDEVILKRKDLAGHVNLGDYKATSYFNVGVTNISNDSIYMPKIELGDVISQLKSHGIYIKGEAELKHEATFLEAPDGTRTKTSNVSTLESGYTLINYYSLNFTNASGLTDKVLLAPLTSIVIAAANDKDVKVDTKVQSTLFEEYYYGKLFNSHVHTFKESASGDNVKYTCPCGYSYRVVVADEETSLYDPAGAKILKEVGFDIETVLSNITFSEGKVIGPSINILGKDFPLFELDTSFKLPLLNSSSVSVDPETQTIKIIVGAKDNDSATIQQPEKADSYWKDSYGQLKNMFQKIEGDKASTQKLYNDFRRLRKGMKGLESKGFSGQSVGFDFDCNLVGYIEFSYNKNSFTFINGGLIAGVNLGVSYTFRPPIVKFIYIKLGLTGGLNDNLDVSYKNEKLEIANTLTASLGANAHLGIGDSNLIKTYVEGYIKGEISASFTLPAKTLEECLLLKFTASGGITTEVFGHKVEALSSDEIKFTEQVLYPKKQKQYSLRSINSETTEKNFEFENSQVEIMPRSYSVSKEAIIEGVSFKKEDLYQYPNPTIVSYGENKKLLLWIDDDGSKSDINRTSVFASVYSDGSWSEPMVAVESDGFCEGIKAVSNGENVYIVYSTTPSALKDDVTIEEAIKTSEIYFACFNGSSFSEPIRITENSFYELGYVIGANKEGKVSIAWIENDENNFVMSSGITCINTVTVDGNDVSEPVNIATGDEITAIGMSENGESLYWADVTTADLYCFVDNERKVIYDASENIKNINISNDSVWFIADEKLYCYADSNCTEISSNVPGDIKIVSDGMKTILLTKGSDEKRGYVFAAELTEDEEPCFAPVFSDDDCFIREISATYSSEGNLIIALNAVKNTENSTGDSSLYVLDSSSYCDISVGDFSVEFDDSKNMCTAEYCIINNSANVVNAISVEIKNSNGDLVLNSEIRKPILPGEVQKFFSNFECNEKIDRQQFTISVTTNDTDVYMDDNTAVYSFDRIDIGFVNMEFKIVDGAPYINGELDNYGYTDATNIDVTLKDKITGKEILREQFNSVSTEKNQVFSFKLPEKYYSSIDDMIKLELIVDAEEFESSYENNIIELSYNSFEDIAGSIECVNHVFNLVSTTDSTCIKAGTNFYECKYCDNVKEENIPINENNHGEVIIKNKSESTCADFGYSGDGCCSLCGKVLEFGEPISKKEHSWDDGIVTLKPTCIENGSMIFTCKLCGNTYCDSIEAIGHNEIIVSGKPASCSNTGLTEGKKCSICDETLVEQTVINKLKHSYKSVVTAPTCTADGYTTYTCSICKDTYKSKETAKLGHSMESTTVIEQPKCTENGRKIVECSRCNYSEVKEIPATGHNYQDGVCIACGDSIRDNCSCNCHKSGFMGFIWKVIRVFYKLFGTNEVCSCGVAHY